MVYAITKISVNENTNSMTSISLYNDNFNKDKWLYETLIQYYRWLPVHDKVMTIFIKSALLMTVFAHLGLFRLTKILISRETFYQCFLKTKFIWFNPGEFTLWVSLNRWT